MTTHTLPAPAGTPDDPAAVPGTFSIQYSGDGSRAEWFRFLCPCGCGDILSVPLIPYGSTPHFTFDENTTSPTLTPTLGDPPGGYAQVCTFTDGSITAGIWAW